MWGKERDFHFHFRSWPFYTAAQLPSLPTVRLLLRETRCIGRLIFAVKTFPSAVQRVSFPWVQLYVSAFNASSHYYCPHAYHPLINTPSCVPSLVSVRCWPNFGTMSSRRPLPLKLISTTGGNFNTMRHDSTLISCLLVTSKSRTPDYHT